MQPREVSNRVLTLRIGRDR